MNQAQIDLARYRMQRAYETQQDAKYLLEKESYNSAINRFYYAIFYAIRALLATKGLDSSKHSGVIALFHKEFVKPGIIPKEIAKIPNITFEKRSDSDYEDYHVFTRSEVDDLAAKSEIFLTEVNKVLDKIL